MNIRTSYFIYTADGYKTTSMIDRETGSVYTVKPVGKTPRTQAIVDAYRPVGGVGYFDTEYNVWEVQETGEQFVYPFSYGYAPAEWVQEIIAKATANKPVVETIVTETPAPVVKMFGSSNSNRRKIELAAKAQKNLSAIIERIEHGYGYKSRIDSEVITSIWFVFPNQYAVLDTIINQHTDFSHDVVLTSALPALRSLLTEITVENVRL